MLRKSKVNPNPPLIMEGKPAAKGVKTVPNRPNSTRNRVIVSEAKASGRKGRTFRAPRVGEGSNATVRGYTKVG